MLAQPRSRSRGPSLRCDALPLPCCSVETYSQTFSLFGIKTRGSNIRKRFGEHLGIVDGNFVAHTSSRRCGGIARSRVDLADRVTALSSSIWGWRRTARPYHHQRVAFPVADECPYHLVAIASSADGRAPRPDITTWNGTSTWCKKTSLSESAPFPWEPGRSSSVCSPSRDNARSRHTWPDRNSWSNPPPIVVGSSPPGPLGAALHFGAAGVIALVLAHVDDEGMVR